MPKPKTKAISRNMVILALEVAASACSPRKRPTQIALIEPFSDWRIEEMSVGTAKASKALPIGPCVRSMPPRAPGGRLAMEAPLAAPPDNREGRDAVPARLAQPGQSRPVFLRVGGLFGV